VASGSQAWYHDAQHAALFGAALILAGRRGIIRPTEGFYRRTLTIPPIVVRPEAATYAQLAERLRAESA